MREFSEFVRQKQPVIAFVAYTGIIQSAIRYRTVLDQSRCFICRFLIHNYLLSHITIYLLCTDNLNSGQLNRYFSATSDFADFQL